MDMPPQVRDVPGYVRCYRCTNRFIPTYVSPATASIRCPHCQLSSRLSQLNREYPMIPLTPPPPTPTPTPPSQTTPTPLHTSSDDDDYDYDYDEEFNTLVDRIASETNDHYEPRPTPASKSFINSLKHVQLIIVSRPILKQLINAGPCAICSDEFKLLEKVNKLSCRHWFHTDCIVQWLNRKNNCPLCRHEFPNTDDHSLRLENQTTETTSGNSSSTLSESQPVPSERVRRTARMRVVFVHRRLADR